MAKDRTDMVRFSAYSMKDLITRKLTENSKFTDQIYEGSNLAVLIDIVSYMYQCLVFQLNHAASESMFADTQIYENIVRLCRFIGYNPRGIQPSSLAVAVQTDADSETVQNIEDKEILPMSVVDFGKIDSQGRHVCFSTTLWNHDNNAGGFKISDTNSGYANLTLVNGQWKRYSTVFTASGLEYETFILDGLKSDSDAGSFIAGGYVEVFVMNEDGTPDGWWRHDLDDIFIKRAQDFTVENRADRMSYNNIYNEDAAVYSLYLNSDKTFCIKFGNGVVGRKLKRGQRLFVFYLDTNGFDGQVELDENSLAGLTLRHSPQMFNLGQKTYGDIFYPKSGDAGAAMNETAGLYQNIRLIPTTAMSTAPAREETVDQIRANAPDWFKTGNRLITKKDYEYFIRSNSGMIANTVVADVKCMNNWDYLATFYKWLYYLGGNPAPFTGKTPDWKRYLKQSRIIQGGYEYVDSADSNNLYIWIQPSINGDSRQARQNVIERFKKNLNTAVLNIKTLTTELYPLACVQSMFDVSFAPPEHYYKSLIDPSVQDWSYIEVTMDDSAVYVNSSVKQQVVQALHDMFDPNKCRIGQKMDYNATVDAIYAINGVVNVRTVFSPDGDMPDAARACNGLSFAVWSDPVLQGGNLIDVGVDLAISNTSAKLQAFQFPTLKNYGNMDYWYGKIKVIKKSLTTVNPIKF